MFTRIPRCVYISLMLSLLVACVMLLLFTASCNSSSSLKEPLALKVELRENEVHSIEEVSGLIYLTNQSDSPLLVHSRLHLLPQQVPPFVSEVLLVISDSAGNLVDKGNAKIDFIFPSEKTLTVLKPGKEIVKFFNLSVWFLPGEIKVGETYTIMVIYQNEFDATKIIDGVQVHSWIGAVRSNKETFVILP